MFDLHVHTCYSLDGNEKPEEIVKYLKKKGFKGAAIVDHNTLKGALEVKSSDFLIIPGMEIKTGKGKIKGRWNTLLAIICQQLPGVMDITCGRWARHMWR
ncbi:hypothetical protein B6U81_07505 [Thermoplasmatales archaeon ex4484_30]|nr:MAG: hypothetical protein B6U81_07505 [Thermoplasmatales archaeon ex4484_30]